MKVVSKPTTDSKTMTAMIRERIVAACASALICSSVQAVATVPTNLFFLPDVTGKIAMMWLSVILTIPSFAVSAVRALPDRS